MSGNRAAVEEAKRLIAIIGGNTDVPISETLEDLETLKEDIEDRINALPSPDDDSGEE